MGRAISDDNKSDQYCGVFDLSKQEATHYIYDMLGSIQEIALDKDMPSLARLIADARLEAKSHM
jgi:hypothetical protein